MFSFLSSFVTSQFVRARRLDIRSKRERPVRGQVWSILRVTDRRISQASPWTYAVRLPVHEAGRICNEPDYWWVWTHIILNTKARCKCTSLFKYFLGDFCIWWKCITLSKVKYAAMYYAFGSTCVKFVITLMCSSSAQNTNYTSAVAGMFYYFVLHFNWQLSAPTFMSIGLKNPKWTSGNSFWYIENSRTVANVV